MVGKLALEGLSLLVDFFPMGAGIYIGDRRGLSQDGNAP